MNRLDRVNERYSIKQMELREEEYKIGIDNNSRRCRVLEIEALETRLII